MGLENNKKYYEVLNSKVNLTSKPVAIKLINSKEDVPEGISLLNDKIRHCEMVKNASLGEKFYTTIDQHLCLGGAGAIGLRDMPPKLANGEKYLSLGRFKDLETAKSLTKELSIVEDKRWGIMYAPLDEADFEADVIQIITEPVNGMILAQSIVYSSGTKVEATFAGIQSLCGDTFSKPYNDKSINFTLGCDGSRKAAKIQDNEMIIGISKDKIDEIIFGLESMS